MIAEVERSLHDAIMIVKRSITHKKLLLVVVPLKWNYRNIYVIIVDKFMKQQLIIAAFAKALEVIQDNCVKMQGLIVLNY